MRLGITSYAYRWSIGAKGFTPKQPLSTRQFVARALRHRVDGAQICDHLDFVSLPVSELREIRRIAEDQHIFVETGASNVNPSHLLKLIAVSAELGAGLMRVVPDVQRGPESQDLGRQIARSIEDIRQILPAARGSDVRIAVENHGQIPSEELRAIVKAFDDEYVGVCLDTMNSVVLLENPLTTVEALAPLATSVHFKDFRIEPSPRGHRIIGVPLGEGMVDFQRILKLIKESGRDPNVCIELYVDRKDSEQESLAWEEDCVEKSVRYARGVLEL